MQAIESGKKIRIFLIIVSVLYAIKYIVVDFGIDAAFQITMSYRYASGDLMFREMWEPYQTSVFICALLIKLYTLIFHTTTGIVLFIQTIGVMIDMSVSVFLYKTVRKFSVADDNTAFAMAWVFFMISPKDVPTPEYANMQVWFTMLLGLFLFYYFQKFGKVWLVLGALSLCCAVLSYPSCLILYLVVAVLMLFRKDAKGFVLFSIICAVIGLAFLGMLFARGLSVNELFTDIHYMLGIETSHSMSTADKLIWYSKSVCQIIVAFTVIYGILYIILGKVRRAVIDACFLGIILCVSIWLTIRSNIYNRYAYAVIFLAIMAIGFKYRKKLSKNRYLFYSLCSLLSCAEFIGTLMLTNLGLIASLPYLLVAAVMAFIPISEGFKDCDRAGTGEIIRKIVIASSVVFLLGRNGLLIRPYNGDVNTIFSIRGIVKDGPGVGLITEYMGAYMQNETLKEWKEYVPEGSNIYIVGDSVDSIPYLFSDVNIAAPSLVPTPGYNDLIAEYWEINPEKYPDVIVVSCWYGELKIDEDSWMMSWIEDEFKPAYYVDGKYWRYYYSSENK